MLVFNNRRRRRRRRGSPIYIMYVVEPEGFLVVHGARVQWTEG